mgnify:FL=1
MKKILFKIRRKLGLVKPDEYLDYLRKLGIAIGKGTHAFTNNFIIDTQRPWMIKIGEYCKITDGVIILQHDYSRSVLRRVYGDVVGESKETIIGNNVFLGINSIILMGTHIGDNVIVGAGSVVSGNIPSNVVVAGNPAKIIRTLDDHYELRKSKYQREAMEQAKLFYKCNGRFPTVAEMGAFFPLYLQRSIQALHNNNVRTNLSGDNEEEIVEAFLKSTPSYHSYESFIEDIKKEM